jgi:hypothetical protein
MSLDQDARQAPLLACPRCGDTIYRVHRRPIDRLRGLIRPLRRYRCRSHDCGWEGLRTPAETRHSREGVRSFAMGWALAVLLLMLIASGAAYLIYKKATSQPGSAWNWLAAIARSAAPAQPIGGAMPSATNSGCIWEGPGVQPYTGTFVAAVTAAGLPAEVVNRLATMHEAHLASDRLEISSTAIRSADHLRNYKLATRAMSFGDKVCFGTTIAIPSTVTLGADLYEAVDATNQRYLVMVVTPGNNVGVLEEQGKR